MSKTILLTSGTSGIGKAIAIKIIKESCCDDDKLIINYGHNDEAAINLKNSFSQQEQKKIYLIKADMSCEDGLNVLVEKTLEITKSIDWLILNTGIGTYEKFDNYTFELCNKIMNTNVIVPQMLVKCLKPYINKHGKILFMGSHAGEATYSSSIIYSISKAAIHHLAKCLPKEFDDKLVSVNAIAPGFVETPWQNGRSQESYDRINNKIAMHRFAESDEVAKLCYDVLTNDYINATVLSIHGGYDYF